MPIATKHCTLETCHKSSEGLLFVQKHILHSDQLWFKIWKLTKNFFPQLHQIWRKLGYHSTLNDCYLVCFATSWKFAVIVSITTSAIKCGRHKIIIHMLRFSREYTTWTYAYKEEHKHNVYFARVAFSELLKTTRHKSKCWCIINGLRRKSKCNALLWLTA